MKGKVKWFDVNRGFGFVVKEDGTETHISARNIKSGRTFVGLTAGDTIEFDEKKFRKGMEAVNVTLAEDDKAEAKTEE